MKNAIRGVEAELSDIDTSMWRWTLTWLERHPVAELEDGTIVALEAILLASIILMRQSRMSRRAEERDQLMLQVLLLTEKEITAVLGMDRQIARKVGLHLVADDKEIEQLSKHTSIDDVAQTIKDTLPSE